MMKLAQEGVSLPGLNVGFDRILHGEQYMELKRPLPLSARLKHKLKLRDAYDKGEHAVAVMEVKSFDESGQEVAYNEMTSFLRGCGGWGGDRGPSGDVNVPPARDPDAIVEEKTPESQALLYRLSGDWNPLHVDPDFAKAFGFDRPILHGLCTFGYAGRHVLKAFCGGDPRRFKSIKVRFGGIVYPGETLVTQMWKDTDRRVLFETSVKERDKVVLKNAAIELWESVAEERRSASPRPASRTETVTSSAGQPQSASPQPASRTETVASSDVFSAIGSYLSRTPDLVSRSMVVLEFRLSNPDSVWTLDLKAGNGGVAAAPASKPDATLSCSEEDFVGMCLGTTDAMKLFMSGKLKIAGNMAAAQKLEFLKKLDQSLIRDAMQSRLGLKTGNSPPAQSGGKAAHAPDVFGKSGRPGSRKTAGCRPRMPGISSSSRFKSPTRRGRSIFAVRCLPSSREVMLIRRLSSASPTTTWQCRLEARRIRRTYSCAAGCAWTAMSSWLTHWISWWVRKPFKLRQDGGKKN